MDTATTPVVLEIINPSDAYTIKAPDIVIAAAAIAVVGNGQYGGSDADDNSLVPMFAFGGHEAWFAEHDTTLGAVLSDRKAEVADALDSVIIGGFDARGEVDAARKELSAEQFGEWFAERHDRMRSSLNDIGGRAYQYAKALRSE